MISYSIKHDFVISAINPICYYFQQVMGNLVLDLLKRKFLFPLKNDSTRWNTTSFLGGRLEILQRRGLGRITQQGQSCHPGLERSCYSSLVKSTQSSEGGLCSTVLMTSFKQGFKRCHPTVTPSPTWSLSPRWFTKAPIVNVAGSGVRRFSSTPPMMHRLLIIPG